MAANDDSMWLRRRVGEARAARYVRIAARWSQQVETVYRLDVALRDALRPELEAVEVALRTRYHEVMTQMYRGSTVWLLDPALPAREVLSSKRWEKEFDDLVSGRCSVHAVVDRVSFGFWARLTVARHEHQMWVPYLRHAFISAPSRQQVHQVVEATVRLRNRVHHYNTVIDLHQLPYIVDDLFWLLDNLTPDLAHERRVQTGVRALLAQHNWEN